MRMNMKLRNDLLLEDGRIYEVGKVYYFIDFNLSIGIKSLAINNKYFLAKAQRRKE